MIYADSSFILRLLSNEDGTERAVAAYRRLGRAPMALSQLHEIEVRNGFRLKAFVAKAAAPAARRPAIDRALLSWERRWKLFVERKALREIELSWPEVIKRALAFSAAHTLKLGTRALDILHVAAAVEMNIRAFVTSDALQAKLARTEGLNVTLVE